MSPYLWAHHGTKLTREISPGAKPLDRSRRGRQAEDLALKWLQARGLQLICRNFHCRWGELDLVMREDEEIVVVEVRSRAHSRHLAPEVSVDYRKKGKIIRATEVFIDRNSHLTGPVRIDVIAVTGHERQHVSWIRNAFTADE